MRVAVCNLPVAPGSEVDVARDFLTELSGKQVSIAAQLASVYERLGDSLPGRLVLLVYVTKMNAEIVIGSLNV